MHREVTEPAAAPMRAVAAKLGTQLVELYVGGPAEYHEAFAAMRSAPTKATLQGRTERRLAAEEPMVCMTLRWRGLDSKFQFRATFGGLVGLRDTRSAQSSGSYRSPFRLAAGGSGFELRLTGFGPKLRRLSAGLKVSWHSAESTHRAREQRDRRWRHGVVKPALHQRSVQRQRTAGLSPQGARSPAARHHLAPPTNSPDRFRAGRSGAPSGSSGTRSHDTASAARSRS